MISDISIKNSNGPRTVPCGIPLITSVRIPGWNEYVREHHKIVRNAFKWWNLNNRPRDGYIYHKMRTSRARFKYVLRFTRSIEDTARADSLAKDLADGTIDDFWGNVRKMNSGNAIQANTIDGCSGEPDIADYWKNHFLKLLNANSYDATLKTSLMSKFNKVLYCKDILIPSSLIRSYQETRMW